MIKRVAIILFTITLLTSCGSSIKIVSKGFTGETGYQKVETKKERKKFHVTQKVWQFAGAIFDKEVSLFAILKEGDISPDECEIVTVKLSTTWGDALWSLIPLYSKRTVEVSGELASAKDLDINEQNIETKDTKNSTKDAEEDPDFSNDW